jgi:hypothetical protein
LRRRGSCGKRQKIKQCFGKEKKEGLAKIRMRVKSGVNNNKTGGKRR